jgi:hypothetical protein
VPVPLFLLPVLGAASSSSSPSCKDCECNVCACDGMCASADGECRCSLSPSTLCPVSIGQAQQITIIYV